MCEKETLKELRNIQKNKENWETNIPLVANKLKNTDSPNVKAKALWILGEMGLKYPKEIEPYTEEIVKYMESENPKLKERSINAIGRIGRADKNLILPYLTKLLNTRNDTEGAVRLSFIWACENIATNSPELFYKNLEIFYEMFEDSYEKVRIEAPEIFRVIGKRKPKYVKPYLEKLKKYAENDEHPIVRIHCEGAIRITEKALSKD